jgi:hypothetical protein
MIHLSYDRGSSHFVVDFVYLIHLRWWVCLTGAGEPLRQIASRTIEAVTGAFPDAIAGAHHMASKKLKSTRRHHTKLAGTRSFAFAENVDHRSALSLKKSTLRHLAIEY